MNKQNKPQVYLHGECMIIQSKIPSGAEQEQHKGEYVIIANSEVTGNHHVIELEPGIEFFKHQGKRFVKNSKPAKVKCVIKERHDTVTLPAGEWQIDYQQEYDYFAMVKRNVAD